MASILKVLNGGHAKYTNGEKTTIISIHKKDISMGTLKAIERQTGIKF